MEAMKKEPRKQCSTCKDWKLLGEFFKEKKKPMGVQSRCKLCHVRGVKAWKYGAKVLKEAEEYDEQHGQPATNEGEAHEKSEDHEGA